MNDNPLPGEQEATTRSAAEPVDSLTSMLEVLAQQLALAANERSGAEDLAVAVRALVVSQSGLIESQLTLMEEQRKLAVAQRDITEVQTRLLQHLGASDRSPSPRGEAVNDVPPPAPPFADPDMIVISGPAETSEVKTTRVHSQWPWSSEKHR